MNVETMTLIENIIKKSVYHFKGTNKATTKRERERERERANLLSEIQQLEAIINRTPQQEQRLRDLREQLTNLENSQGGDPKKPTNYLPWIIGGIAILLVVGIIIYFLLKNKKNARTRHSFR